VQFYGRFSEMCARSPPSGARLIVTSDPVC